MVVVLGAQSFGYQGAELEEEVRTHGWAELIGPPKTLSRQEWTSHRRHPRTP